MTSLNHILKALRYRRRLKPKELYEKMGTSITNQYGIDSEILSAGVKKQISLIKDNASRRDEIEKKLDKIFS
ncbi:MAG TPA: hypothetical protein VK044_03805 [Virgibacillus sp.]|nr:hypothetical protein [Virgibacillus sp.]